MKPELSIKKYGAKYSYKSVYMKIGWINPIDFSRVKYWELHGLHLRKYYI